MAYFERLVAAIGRLEDAIHNKQAKTNANQAEMLAKMDTKIETDIKAKSFEASRLDTTRPGHKPWKPIRKGWEPVSMPGGKR
jgi:hypothetical protein